jgi:hypothetical protein
MSILYLKFKLGQEMRPISLTININSKSIMLLLALVLMFIGGKNIKGSYAQTSTNLFIESCGLILNRNFGGWVPFYQNANTVAQNFVDIINFDTCGASIFYNTVSGLGTSKSTEQGWYTSNSGNVVKPGPFSGSYYVSIGGSTTPDYFFVPVNGGNSFLVTESNSTKTTSTVICQKI